MLSARNGSGVGAVRSPVGHSTGNVHRHPHYIARTPVCISTHRHSNLPGGSGVGCHGACCYQGTPSHPTSTQRHHHRAARSPFQLSTVLGCGVGLSFLRSDGSQRRRRWFRGALWTGRPISPCFSMQLMRFSKRSKKNLTLSSSSASASKFMASQAHITEQRCCMEVARRTLSCSYP